MKAQIKGLAKICKVTTGTRDTFDILRDYDAIVKRQVGTFDQTWFERNSTCLRAAFWIRFQRSPKMPALSVHVISYDIPENPQVGLERRQANSLLRSLGLRSPTTQEMFQIASQTLITDFKLFRVIEENSCRDLVALTPFHPEMPTFMKFGVEDGKRISFKMEDHRLGTKGGYFFSDWDIPAKTPIPKDDTKKHFPMLLGVFEK